MNIIMPKAVDTTLRTEVMSFLNESSLKFSQGNLVAAEQALQSAWIALPSPQYEWDFGQLVIQQTINFYVKANRPTEALRWIDPLALSFGSADDGTVAMIAGTVYFEAGKFDAAYERFEFLFAQFGKRPFQGRDKKYLDFYLVEKKLRNAQ